MAIIYYPTDAQVFTRQVAGGQMIEMYIDVAPNQIIVISGSTPTTASIDFITASYAATASVTVTSLTSSYFYRESGSGAWKIYVDEVAGDLTFDFS